MAMVCLAAGILSNCNNDNVSGTNNNISASGGESSGDPESACKLFSEVNNCFYKAQAGMHEDAYRAAEKSCVTILKSCAEANIRLLEQRFRCQKEICGRAVKTNEDSDKIYNYLDVCEAKFKVSAPECQPVPLITVAR
jgi:hypothetical protein